MTLDTSRRSPLTLATLALVVLASLPAAAQVCEEPIAAPPEPVKPTTSVTADTPTT